MYCTTSGDSLGLVNSLPSTRDRLGEYPAISAASDLDSGPSGPPNTNSSANLFCISVNLLGTPILTF